MPLERIRALHAVADAHPDMPVRDALTATADAPRELTATMQCTDDWRWCLYSGAALQGLVMRGGHTPGDLTALAGRFADAMLAEYRRRFDGVQLDICNEGAT